MKITKKVWSRKGHCPSCGVTTGSKHSKSCQLDYSQLEKYKNKNNQTVKTRLFGEAIEKSFQGLTKYNDMKTKLMIAVYTSHNFEIFPSLNKAYNYIDKDHSRKGFIKRGFIADFNKERIFYEKDLKGWSYEDTSDLFVNGIEISFKSLNKINI